MRIYFHFAASGVSMKFSSPWYEVYISKPRHSDYSLAKYITSTTVLLILEKLELLLDSDIQQDKFRTTFPNTLKTCKCYCYAIDKTIAAAEMSHIRRLVASGFLYLKADYRSYFWDSWPYRFHYCYSITSFSSYGLTKTRSSESISVFPSKPNKSLKLVSNHGDG